MTKIKLLWIIILGFSILSKAQSITEKSVIGDWKYESLVLPEDQENKRALLESMMQKTAILINENHEYSLMSMGFESNGAWNLKLDTLFLIDSLERENQYIVSNITEKTITIQMGIKSNSPTIIFSNHNLLDPETIKAKEEAIVKKKQDDIDMLTRSVKTKPKALVKKWYIHDMVSPNEDDAKSNLAKAFVLNSSFTFQKDKYLVKNMMGMETLSTWKLVGKTEIHIVKDDKIDIYRVNQISEHELILTDINAETTFHFKDVEYL